jgi:2-methylisocitrate lyase-like PEP mutase family enzyme
MGWSESDLAGEGSDAIIDAVVAIGDVDAIVERVRAHLDAGADHVCVQFRAERSADPCLEAFRELAAAFSEIGASED